MNINLLKKRIVQKRFILGVIGLGYVGLPIANRFIKKGIKVYALEQDLEKVRKLRKGINYINNSSLKKFNYFKKNKNNISNDYSILKNCDVILVCLPTPLKNKKPDMSFVYNCAKRLKKVLKNYQIIILESTVFPGATVEFSNKFLNKGQVLGKNIFLGYSPERENPGDRMFSYKTTPKIVSGYSVRCLEFTETVYKHVVKKIVKAKSLDSAETSKLLENLYRSVNIGLVNELKIICDKLKIDVFEVIQLASTKNFGFQKFMPGPGLGGHCIPIDPFYLSWASQQKGYDPKFIRLSGELNSLMPKWVVKKMLGNIKIKKPSILLLGISYKKNVDDDRESPAFEIMKLLKEKKIKFQYNDPYFPTLRKGRNFNFSKKSILLNAKNLKKFDATLIVTDHDFYDYKLIYKNSKKIFDARGVYKKFNYPNVVYC
tara:strand:+ start:15828 stop:17117 length:1290 start_codon:yes stop_codon:yes gene_type:complete